MGAREPLGWALAAAVVGLALLAPSAARAQTGRSHPADWRLSLDAGWRTTVSHDGSWYKQLREAGYDRQTQGPALALTLGGYPVDDLLLGARVGWEHGRGGLEGREAKLAVQRVSGVVVVGPSLRPALSYGSWMELALELGLGMTHDRWELREAIESSNAMRLEVGFVVGWTSRVLGIGLRAAVTRTFFGEMGPQRLSTDVATVLLQARTEARW